MWRPEELILSSRKRTRHRSSQLTRCQAICSSCRPSKFDGTIGRSIAGSCRREFFFFKGYAAMQATGPRMLCRPSILIKQPSASRGDRRRQAVSARDQGVSFCPKGAQLSMVNQTLVKMAHRSAIPTARFQVRTRWHRKRDEHHYLTAGTGDAVAHVRTCRLKTSWPARGYPKYLGASGLWGEEVGA